MVARTAASHRDEWLQRAVLPAAYVAAGLALFLFGNNWNSRFPTNDSTAFKWGLVLLFLLLTVALRASRSVRASWELAAALCVAATANALNWHLGNWLAPLLPPAGSTARLLAVDKLAQCIPIALSILVLARLSGRDAGSLYLTRGDMRWGLRFGLTSFAIFAGLFAVIAVLQAGAPASSGLAATGVPLATIVAGLPWILVFCLTNSFMEELWFRGLFLQPLAAATRPLVAIVATAIVFGVAHLGATYIRPIESIGYVTVATALGIVNGYSMVRSHSIWGSMLFHAGYDVIVIIPIIVSVA